MIKNREERTNVLHFLQLAWLIYIDCLSDRLFSNSLTELPMVSCNVLHFCYNTSLLPDFLELSMLH